MDIRIHRMATRMFRRRTPWAGTKIMGEDDVVSVSMSQRSSMLMQNGYLMSMELR